MFSTVALSILPAARSAIRNATHVSHVWARARKAGITM
jgi:hypothetical protein